jgi:hypothetical protein
LKENNKKDFAMTLCTTKKIEFARSRGRKIEAQFSGGDVTSDGGILLLRMVDQKLGLTRRIAGFIEDPRQQSKCDHEQITMLRQRIFGLALGYEDLSDHITLRRDKALQFAVEENEELASSSTLCRLENRITTEAMWKISEALVDVFIGSHKKPPRKLVLDFDATNDPVHGSQLGAVFHGYYDQYCFLPLYVFCGEFLLAAYLRPGDSDAAKHTWGILALLVRKLRQAWPKVKIVFRGDSGFCRHQMMGWCDREKVDYIIGIGKNDRLLEASQVLIDQAADRYGQTGDKQRLFGSFDYAAKTWKRSRRVIVKAEHTDKGSNPRYVVTSLRGDARYLYDKVYCARGEMENRIKEQQLYLFADRTSCMNWLPNQFRLLLSGLAYTLLQTIRRLGLCHTDLAAARCDTIRLKLLKIGAVIIENSRRIRFLLSSAYPLQRLFRQVVANLEDG